MRIISAIPKYFLLHQKYTSVSTIAIIKHGDAYFVVLTTFPLSQSCFNLELQCMTRNHITELKS